MHMYWNNAKELHYFSKERSKFVHFFCFKFCLSTCVTKQTTVIYFFITFTLFMNKKEKKKHNESVEQEFVQDAKNTHAFFILASSWKLIQIVLLSLKWKSRKMFPPGDCGHSCNTHLSHRPSSTIQNLMFTHIFYACNNNTVFFLRHKFYLNLLFRIYINNRAKMKAYRFIAVTNIKGSKGKTFYFHNLIRYFTPKQLTRQQL